MEAATIVNFAANRIEDPGFTDSDLLATLNAGVEELANDLDLPFLRASAPVTTTALTSSVALPDDYMKRLFWVSSLAQRRKIGVQEEDYEDLLRFLKKYPVQNIIGAVTDVCVDGLNLLYQGMTADTLTLRYYSKPVEVTLAEGQIPLAIPVSFHMSVLVPFICKETYNQIEDGIEGKKANTDKWENLYQIGKAKLAKFIEITRPREAKYVEDLS